jgi:outer membrane protein insertion porin family
VNFIRTADEARNYYEVFSDIVSVFKVQAGNVSAWGGKNCACWIISRWGQTLCGAFGCRSGPRDLTPGTTNDAPRGSLYWGATVEAQTPLYFLPKDIGIKVAVFADAGSVEPPGPTSWNVTGETLQVGLDSSSMICSSVGVGLLWDLPLGPFAFRPCLSALKVLRDTSGRRTRSL